ncbi:hypothetical protein SELMODRAFT_402247 [Selaginella moellendorffii]|uniref:Amino acid transporter transmembrane domain-containing protein n=1 Tax=Selaginella moellendorffii TaxID=88036 RepID=D8QQ20_SELML|nr:hypothetical protein SELMODRAFT_402247 [Selaginella moellendorffii]
MAAPDAYSAILIEMHETEHGRRFDRYHELGQHVLGHHLGFWLIAPLQAIAQVGIDKVYIVAGANSLEHVYSLLDECKELDVHKCKGINLTYWMILFIGVQLFGCHSTHWFAEENINTIKPFIDEQKDQKIYLLLSKFQIVVFPLGT